MKQTTEQIVHGYEQEDPWGYKTDPADAERKRLIIGICELFAPLPGVYIRALDVACGEGWITTELPALQVYGYELSDKARARFPTNVQDGRDIDIGEKRFGLVTCMGALYAHYDWESMTTIIRAAASDVIVISGIKDWELTVDFEDLFRAKQVFEAEFPYLRPEGAYVQSVRVFKK